MCPLRGWFQPSSGSKVGLASPRVSGLKGRGGSREERPEGEIGGKCRIGWVAEMIRTALRTQMQMFVLLLIQSCM